LFSHEPITFKDKCETKKVKSKLYLDFNENLPEGEHDYHFVGRVGQFCPIKPGCGGGLLVKTGTANKDKYDAVTGMRDRAKEQRMHAHALTESAIKLRTKYKSRWGGIE
jgi:hypothetical protein